MSLAHQTEKRCVIPPLLQVSLSEFLFFFFLTRRFSIFRKFLNNRDEGEGGIEFNARKGGGESNFEQSSERGETLLQQ